MTAAARGVTADEMATLRRVIRDMRNNIAHADRRILEGLADKFRRSVGRPCPACKTPLPEGANSCWFCGVYSMPLGL